MLGVLGGMGPLASAQFVARLTLLTPASRDQDHIPLVLWSDPRVPDRVAAWRGGESPLPVLLAGLRGLEAAGCTIVAMPCNTAHAWHAEIQAATRLPVLHIVKAALEELRRQGISGPVGLMGTAATLGMRLYQEVLEPAGHLCLVPTEDQMAALVSPAIAQVKANDCPGAYAALVEVAGRLAARGAEAIVLGCTEIPLGLAAGPAPSVPVVDTIDALARAAIRAWGRETAA